MGENLSRRSFVRGAAITSALAAGGALSACAAESDQGTTSPENPRNITWDHEVDLVVVGSGTAVVGALLAAEHGASTLVLEKNGWLGGTTNLSGCVCWVPGNHVMEQFGYGPDTGDEEILNYLQAADVSSGGFEEVQLDYIQNARKVFWWFEDTWSIEMGIFPATCDYYDLPGAMGLGRSLGFVDSISDATMAGMDDVAFSEVFLSRLEEFGVESLTNTEVQELIVEDGRVVGVKADSDGTTIYAKGSKGVLLGCGGFEHNESMRKQYLYGPLQGIASPSTNTGDGHRMGMRVGADLGNMSSIWGNPFYIVGDDPAANPLADYGMYAGLPGAVYVNQKGKRFVNESAGYDLVTNALYNYSTLTYSFSNMPAYMIFDAKHVEHYGYPGFAEEMPEWTKEYETIEELAADCNIDIEGLKQELEHFSTMCEAGVDSDYGRGAWLHDTIQAEAMGERPELTNPTMDIIAQPPFYAVQVGPGAFGTNGGLRVDKEARVLDTYGEPIEGLYSCGNNASSIVGSTYPGPGGTIGPGFYQAFRAANNALELAIL